jgi:hypothetical protein
MRFPVKAACVLTAIISLQVFFHLPLKMNKNNIVAPLQIRIFKNSTHFMSTTIPKTEKPKPKRNLSLKGNYFQEQIIRLQELKKQIISKYGSVHLNSHLLLRRRPLPLTVNTQEIIRINIIHPGNVKMTGGPLNVLRFANEAKKHGLQARLISPDPVDLTSLLAKIQMITGLSNFSQNVELIQNAYDDKNPINVNPNDIFMATIYWTAPMAYASQKLLKHPNILYFIQDFEVIFHPVGSDWLEARLSYNIPHFPIFNTFLLELYFKKHKLGIFKSEKCGDFCFSTQPAVTLRNLSMNHDNVIKTCLIYARVTEFRNGFDYIVAALSESIRTGIFHPVSEWRFIGVGGSPNEPARCNLGGFADMCLLMISHLQESEYFDLISQSDIGIVLLLTPQFGMVPLDFLAAGLVTITNSFATKTASILQSISPYMVAVDPTIESITSGITVALSKAKKSTQIERVTSFKWNTHWDNDLCFGGKLFDRIKSWMQITVKSHQLNCTNKHV